MRAVLVDTGLDWWLRAFRGASVDYVDFMGTGAAGDPSGHGTRSAMALLCAGRDGSPALCGRLELVVCKAIGGGVHPVARALRWAALRRVAMVVLPFGRLLPQPAVREAVAALARSGAEIYAAAGNRGPDVLLYPAASSRVVAVTGAGPDGRILPECCAGSGVDLIAPGLVRCPLEGGELRGSSIAAVIAAGVRALALEADGGNDHA